MLPAPPSLTRRHSLALLSAAAGSTLPGISRAQSWPSRPVRIVVPFPPGGPADGSARVLAEAMAPRLGQPIVVENRPGAGSIVGTQAVAQSNDGHTLLMGSTSMTILPSLRADLSYDIERDLQPIGMVSTQPLVLSVAFDSPIRTLADVEARGKAGNLTAGNSGNGKLSHLTTELFNMTRDTKIVSVAYRGESALVPDLMNGTTAMAFLNLPSALPLVKSGRLRALGVTSAEPIDALPQVATLRAQGLEDFVILGWAALFAAKDVPSAGLERLETELREALMQSAVRERLTSFGVDPVFGTRGELAAFVKSEVGRWGNVIRSRAIKMD